MNIFISFKCQMGIGRLGRLVQEMRKCENVNMNSEMPRNAKLEKRE